MNLLKLLLPILATVGVAMGKMASTSQWKYAKTACLPDTLVLRRSVGLQEDCRMYVNCAWRMVLTSLEIQFCPSGTLYRPESQHCDKPSAVSCGDRRDPCFGLSDGRYEDKNGTTLTQGGFYVCEGNRLVGGTKCHICHRFSSRAESGCEMIPGCLENHLLQECYVQALDRDAAENRGGQSPRIYVLPFG